MVKPIDPSCLAKTPGSTELHFCNNCYRPRRKLLIPKSVIILARDNRAIAALELESKIACASDGDGRREYLPVGIERDCETAIVSLQMKNPGQVGSRNYRRYRERASNTQ